MRRAGFSLVELLIVIGVIALLIGILLPIVSVARQESRRISCLSNLRQMAQAAVHYTIQNEGMFPVAYWTASNPPLTVNMSWDFTTTTNTISGEKITRPGLLWDGQGNGRVQQCPSFAGSSNGNGETYTGYNYNTSYLGRGQLEVKVVPARLAEIRQPDRTVIFGDGQWKGGANKYMRSPKRSPSEKPETARTAGTQGFRHRSQTNVSYVDGHAATLRDSYSGGLVVWQGTGFVSEDSSLYDFE